MCLSNTIPPLATIMANSQDGPGHNDKYLDMSRFILYKEMISLCYMKVLHSLLKIINKVKVFKK